MVLTARNGHSPFWMMTYYDPTVTDIDLSNIPASELVDIWEEKGIDAAIQAYEEGLALSSNNKQATKLNLSDFTKQYFVKTEDFEFLDGASALLLKEL